MTMQSMVIGISFWVFLCHIVLKFKFFLVIIFVFEYTKFVFQFHF